MEVSVKQFGNKIRMLILKPAVFWKNEKLQPNGVHQLFIFSFLPMVFLAGASEFAGQLLKGSGFYLLFPLMRSLREVLLFLMMYVLSVFFASQFLKPFGGKPNLPAIHKLVAYSLMPVIIVSVVTNLFPFLYVLDVLGFYSFFIFATGVEELLMFSDNRRTRYNFISLFGAFFTYSFLNIFLSTLVSSFL